MFCSLQCSDFIWTPQNHDALHCKANSMHLEILRPRLRTIPRGRMHWVLHPKRFPEDGDASWGPTDFLRTTLRENLKGCQLEVMSQRAPKVLVSNKIVVDSGFFNATIFIGGVNLRREWANAWADMLAGSQQIPADRRCWELATGHCTHLYACTLNNCV